MRFTYGILLIMFLGIPHSVYADEVSLLSGFFRSQDDKPGFAQKRISLGGRYGFAPNEDKRLWFIDAGVESTSYSGDNAPDGSSGIQLGAGQQYFFRNFGKGVHSYLAWAAGFRSSSSADATSKSTSSRIYYTADAGFRFDFSKTFFVDLEAQLFDSSLVETRKVTPTGDGSGSETKINELEVATFSGADSLRFGVGLVF